MTDILQEAIDALEYANENLCEVDGEDEITLKSLTALRAAQKDMVLVPREPSERMVNAIFTHSGNEDFDELRYGISENYKAMIAAHEKGE